ncbi:MAG: zinc-ribbon domain-containing protein [Bacteroidales bacterium]|nr:zinc-ribbon domain-containing protein [Bacteroidales bacterium]
METPKEPQKPQRTYRCNDCGATITRHQVFCPKCGKLLDRYDFEED